MSKHPSPRLDQLRAMREAKFARNAQRQKEAPAAPEPDDSEPAAEKSAASKPNKTEAKTPKKAAKKTAKKKGG